MGKELSHFYQPEKQQEYMKWKKDLQLSNLFFKKLIEDYVQDAFYLYELATSQDTSVSYLLPQLKSIVEVEPFCDAKMSLPNVDFEKGENPKTGCFIANGIYPSLAISINEFAQTGTFAIGVTGRKHSPSFQSQVKYYKQVHQQLLYRGIALNQPIKKSNSSFGSYILTKKVGK